MSSRETPAPLFWTIVLLFAPPDFDLTPVCVWIWHLQILNKQMPGQCVFGSASKGVLENCSERFSRAENFQR
jgi:hypothetical protein